MRIILSSLFTVMFLVACGGSDTPPTPTPFATASPPASAATAVPKPTAGTALEVTAVAKPTEATAPEATTDHADLNSKEYAKLFLFFPKELTLNLTIQFPKRPECILAETQLNHGSEMLRISFGAAGSDLAKQTS